MAKRDFKKRQPLILEAIEKREDGTETNNKIKIDGSFSVETIKRLLLENYGLEISNKKAKILRAGCTAPLLSRLI